MKNPPNFLRVVNVNLIHFDSNNPRGEAPEEIHEDKDFKKLRRSIKD